MKYHPRRENFENPVTSLNKWHGRFATRFVQIDSRESFATEIPVFIARQADSHESLELPIRANHPIRARIVRIDSRESRH